MNEEKNKIKVIFLQKDAKGQMFGSGEWEEGVNVYVKNFRVKSGERIADVDIKTEETYVNRDGKTCNRHKLCGILSLSPESATIVVDMNGKKDKLECTPRQVIGKSNGKTYLILDFAEAMTNVNPYEADLGLESTVDIDDLDQVAESIGL